MAGGSWLLGLAAHHGSSVSPHRRSTDTAALRPPEPDPSNGGNGPRRGISGTGRGISDRNPTDRKVGAELLLLFRESASVERPDESGFLERSR